METYNLITLIFISMLDSRSFTVRQNANVTLDGMGTVAIPQLLFHDKYPNSIESSFRIKRSLQKYNSAMISCMCGKNVPYVDSIPESGLDTLCPGYLRWEVNQFYLHMAKSVEFSARLEEEKKIGGTEEKWVEWKLAGRLWLEDLRANGMSDTELIKGIKLLQIRCDYYLKHNQDWPQLGQK